MGRRALGRACSALKGQSADETDLLTALNRQKLYELRVAQQEIGERVKKLPRLTGRKQKVAHLSSAALPYH